MRKPLILGNWKMNKNKNEVMNFFNELKENSLDLKSISVDFGVAPTCLFIDTAKQNSEGIGNFLIGAQNVYFESKGAFTGEISIDMLKSINTDFVIIGHSERRQIFGETNDLIEKKLSTLLKNEMQTVLCVGETKEERESGIEEKVVGEQLKSAFKNLKDFDVNKIVIAYEPIWAIGTGLTASPEDADNMHKFIRTSIEKMYGKNISDGVRILYGGSVKPANIKDLIAKENIDGALVGGASLDYTSFLDIIKGAI